jgi:hypothetical protein
LSLRPGGAYKAVPGADPKIGTVNTAVNGSYSLTKPRVPGKYYSKVARTVLPNVGNCKPKRSTTLTIN